MNQPALTKRIVDSLGLKDQRIHDVPTEPNVRLTKDEDGPERKDQFHYRSLIGQLNYLTASLQDDASAFEISCEGEEVWSTINSMNVLPATEVTSNEIFELYDSDCCTATDVNHVDTDKEPIVRGQIDIGCSASCTGHREMPHDHTEFSPTHPCYLHFLR